MKDIILLMIVISCLQVKHANSQLIPAELLGEWSFEYELNGFGQVMGNGYDMDAITIEQHNGNVDLDTLLITEYKEPNEYYSARYDMSICSNTSTDFYLFSHLDATTSIGLGTFLSIYWSDSISFNWANLNPGASKKFELISPDTLLLRWETACLAAHCAGYTYFSRAPTVTSIVDLENISEEWNIYPNPAKDYIWIKSNNSQRTNLTKISVIDSKGTVVKIITLNNSQIQLSLNDLDPGLFYIRISNGENFETKKIIVSY